MRSAGVDVARATAATLCALMIAATPCAAQTLPQLMSPAAQHQHPVGTTTEPLFPTRDASGTAWLPDETPMYGVKRTWSGWTVMFHGNVFGQLIYEPGDRHRTGGFNRLQVSSVNWVMAMARRPLGAGRLGFRAMLSAEPWTVNDCGFLNLLATGEQCEGDTIHDRQHPHDLFMELAADYDRPLRGPLRWQIYAGLAGEPALGPAGFPHRPSAMTNPIAPVSHHWLDSTHITFGLITSGIYSSRWKVEMSVFNAREPDRNRADLDLGPLDSVSGRLSFLPTRRLAVQVSAAHLREAEAEFAPQPRSDVNRGTASATYHRGLGATGVWATTIAYGVNAGREIIPGGAFDAVTQAVLLETSATLRERNTWFGRGEIVQKPAHDLHAHEFPTSIFTVAKLEAGYIRHLGARKSLVPGLGATVSANIVAPQLRPRYGGRTTFGFGLFLSLRPSVHSLPSRRKD
jgi:hypothetical protein